MKRFNALRRRLTVEPLEARDLPSLVPAGPEFRANFLTTGTQRYPVVATASTGDSIIAWESNHEGIGTDIFARRFDSAGVAQGHEFRVNTTTVGAQVRPTVATDTAGNFVIAWYGPDGSGNGVYAQRFNAAGAPQGGELRVNTHTTDNQWFPAATMDGTGNFVIAWEGENQDGDDNGIYAQRYDALGGPQGPEFRVNSVTTSYQLKPKIAANGAGDFVIVWTCTSGFGADVCAQVFLADGTPLFGEFQVNTHTNGFQGGSSVALDPGGGFVIAWSSGNQDGSGYGVYARRYGVGGAPMTDGFRVNTFTTGIQGGAAVAMDSAGDFVIAWMSRDQDGSDYGVYAQSFTAPGAPVGGEFRVNTTTMARQGDPKIAMDADGDAVVVWASAVGDGSGYGVFAQRYVESGPAPRVEAVQVNSGQSQRSRVTNLAVTFDRQVTFVGQIADAYTLIRTGGGSVGFSATASLVNGVSVVTLNNFTGPETESGSLRDGRYTLTALASQITAGGQQMASDYAFGDAQGLFRYYGDMNGDRRVDISDFGFFSLAFLQAPNYNAALDFNNDGRIDIADFGQFSVRYFTTLP